MKEYIVYVIPFFFLTIGLELWYGYAHKKKYYNFNDAITNLNIGIGQQTISLILTLAMLGLYSLTFQHFSLIQLPIDNVWVWVGTLIVFDCIYYWAHRWGHEWNVMWGAHIVHHQSDQYNLSVALRQSWFHAFLSFWMFLPLAIAGVPVEVIGGVGGFVTIFQYWIHTKAIKKMPRWFEFIFNTPSHHRVHHATNPQYLDKNYAAVFIFWDRIFGTFAKEVEEPHYGITAGHTSLDPIYANLHFYKEMAIGAQKEKSIWKKFTLIFKSPSYLGNLIKEYYVNQPKVNPKPVSMNMKIYVLIQFIALSGGLVKYIMEFDQLSLFYQIACLGLIILTIQSCGYILENKTKLFPLEIIRLIGAGILLNILYYEQYQDWFTFMLILSVVIGVFSTGWFVYENYIKPKNPINVSNS
jgi:sterol desaturase/sphingolipid hydroxylase (fatty acid hydroxylase superfamily)